MIKTSDYGNQTVDPKGFWITVGVVVAGLGLSGAYYLTTGKMPFVGLGLGRTGALLFLNLCWAGNVYLIARRGWRAAPWNHWLGQIGFSVYLLGTYVYPNSALSTAWVQGPAMLGFGVAILAPYITLSRRNRPGAAGGSR